MDWDASGFPAGSSTFDAGLAEWRARQVGQGSDPEGGGAGDADDRRAVTPGAIRARCGLRFPGMLYAAVASVAGAVPSEPDLAAARHHAGIVQVLSIAAMPSDAPGTLDAPPAIAVVARGAVLARKGLAGLFGVASAGAAAPAEEPAERCAGQWRNGHLRLWLPTWDVAFYRAAAAQLAGLPERRVEVCTAGTGSEAGIASGIVAALALARSLSPAPIQVARYRLSVA